MIIKSEHQHDTHSRVTEHGRLATVVVTDRTMSTLRTSDLILLLKVQVLGHLFWYCRTSITLEFGLFVCLQKVQQSNPWPIMVGVNVLVANLRVRGHWRDFGLEDTIQSL